MAKTPHHHLHTYTSLADQLGAPLVPSPFAALAGAAGADAGLAWWQVLLLVVLPSLLAFVAMDFTWVTLVAAPMLQEVLGGLLRAPPDPLSGVTAWVLVVYATYFFATRTAPSTLTAAMQGFLLGLAVYGVHESTSFALISTWTVAVAAGNVAWGAVACACCAALQHLLIGCCHGGGACSTDGCGV